MTDASNFIGQTISHYRIVERLGGGGMGVVYKAEDTRLDRFVALKFLPEDLSHDRQALERFRREAKAASALNHPNICTIHDIGEENGRAFIAMEYVEGKTLKHAIAGQPMELEHLLGVAIEVADALDAAHAKGIVHRDIKPTNIIVTERGHAKVLDFGLAKLVPTGGAINLSAMPTASELEQLTRHGTAIGTITYMSPEQVRGEELDARTDLFSFWCSALSDGDRSSALPRRDLWRDRGSDTESHASCASATESKLEEIINKALEKDKKLRHQNAADIRTDLRRLKRDSDSGGAVAATAQVKSKPTRESLRWSAVIGATLLVIGLAVGGWLLSSRKAHALTDKDTIVLADFTNTTGDAVFDGTLRQGLSVQLEQSPFLSIISDQQIQQTLGLMGQLAEAKLTPAIARELCQRTGSAAVLDGSIAQIGTQYLLTVKAVNCASGESLASTEAQASDKNHVLDALGKAASEIRNKLGESLSTVQKFDTPLEQATTPSLEALKAFSSGFQVHNTVGDAAAVPFYKQAIELDPNFALAYAWLGLAFNTMGELSMDVECTRKAYGLRDRTSEPEKYFITARFQKVVTGNMEKAEEALQLWIQAYPRSALPHIYLSGAVYPDTAQYEKAVEHGREAVRLSPNFSPSYYVPIRDYISLNRIDEAKATYEQALERKMKSSYFNLALYHLAYAQNLIS